MLTLDKVYKASHLLKSVARYTDMIESNGLAENCDFRLKAENLQLTGYASLSVESSRMAVASSPESSCTSRSLRSRARERVPIFSM